jgi:FKBP12-rapamycin complex-associated protein
LRRGLDRWGSKGGHGRRLLLSKQAGNRARELNVLSVNFFAALDKLIDIEGMENTTRFANYLRHLFPADVKTMTMAARALGEADTSWQSCLSSTYISSSHVVLILHLGKLAQQGGTFTTVFVEFELKRAIEWLTG